MLSHRLTIDGQAYQGDVPIEGPPTPKKLEKCEVQHVPCNNNSHVDALVWLATTKTPPRHTILYRVLSSPTMDRLEILQAEAEDRR
ncbi:hypothetical protein CR513_42914, partial [Mucuna pruriens]